MKKGSLSQIGWEEKPTYLKAVIFDEDDWKNKGTKFQIIKILPKTKINPHHHLSRTEMFFVAKGNGTIMFNGKPHKVKQHDYFLCETGDVHEFINETDDELIILVFRVNDPGDADMIWE